MKTCTVCKVGKDVSEYWRDRRTYDGLDHRCKPCATARNRAWRTKNKAYVAKSAHERTLRDVYGMTPNDLAAMRKKSGGRCAICRLVPKDRADGRTGLHIDHDHETGVVRGLLCATCNTALGNLKDSVELLESAIQYLKGEDR